MLSAVLVAVSVLLQPSLSAAADEPVSSPGFYFRVFGGAVARYGGGNFTTTGGGLGLAVGWAAGPRTALALEAAAHDAAVTSGARQPGFEYDGELGARLALLLDHYLEGTAGTHVQIGAGAQAFVFGGSSVADASYGASGSGSSPLPRDLAPWGPMVTGGIGYDWPLRKSSWTAAGVFVRADVTACFGASGPWIPVGLLAGASIAHF